MRLLHLADRLSDRGGADHHLAQVVRWGVASGHRVTIGCGRVERAATPPDGVVVHRVPGLASRVDASGGLSGLGPLLDAADVVHLHNVMNPTAIATAVDRGRSVATIQDHRFFCPGPGKSLPDGSPCRLTMSEAVCADCLPDRGYRRATLELTRRRLAALGDAAVVVLSDYMAAELDAAGRPGARVIPPWVEVGRERRSAGSRFVIGGRLVGHKGVLDGWRAWCEAGRPMPLVVAGEGPLESRLAGTVRRGWLAPPALRAELRRGRALVFPARWQEPFGILGVEALAEGTPAVVADCGGTGEWSASGCLVVPSGDVTAMADAIRRLAAEPDLALELGRAGRRWVGRRFSRERIAPMLDQLYHAVGSS